MLDYYEHMFYIHVDKLKRKLIESTVQAKAAAVTLFRCPEKGCGRQWPSLDQLARHFGASHCSLQSLQQRDGSALLPPRDVVKVEPAPALTSDRESPGPQTPQMFAEVGGPFQPMASPDAAVGLFACDSDHEQAGWQYTSLGKGGEGVSSDSFR